MANLDYRTAGESHGKACVVLVEGMPAGVPIDLDMINRELRRRQGGYGRGGRQAIETDSLDILSGVRHGKTMGSPIAGSITNRDCRIEKAPPVHRPRPGHADLAGSLKRLTTDCRETLERASARETAPRVAAGAIARCLLSAFDIDVVGFVRRIGTEEADADRPDPIDSKQAAELRKARDASDVYCPDPSATDAMKAAIDRARTDGDTLGGIVEVRVFGVPPGIGSCDRWQDRLDARLACAIVSIQAFKGAEIGGGFELAKLPGSQVHDAIGFDPAQRETSNLGFVRKSNRAGGLEGGMTNGQPVVVRGVMKPISTLLQGMDSVDLSTKQPQRSDYERSDICAVPAASVVAENAVAFEIARALLDKFAGDTLAETRQSWDAYLRMARDL